MLINVETWSAYRGKEEEEIRAEMERAERDSRQSVAGVGICGKSTYWRPIYRWPRGFIEQYQLLVC